MGRMRLDIDAIQSFAKSIAGRISEFDNAVSRTNTLNNSITASWKGKSKEAYEAFSQNIMLNQQQMREIIEMFREYAVETASTFDEVDAECAALIRNSF